jgi:methylmalonyl-CoA/ethylmalonyl-CoA epimerase
MILKIEHIGIAVKEIKSAEKIFSALLNKNPYKKEEVEREGVNTLFYETGDSKIELLESTKENSVISRFIEKRGEGIHHIAFEVDDINKEMQRLKNEGFGFISSEPLAGADNKLIAFIHPKYSNGVLVELCQEKKPQ